MACRNMEKGEEARKEIVEDTKNEDILLQELDLGSFESIQKFAQNFNESKQVLLKMSDRAHRVLKSNVHFIPVIET